MRYEARWDNNINICCSADAIDDAVSCLCSMTSGEGIISIYQSQDNQPPRFLKIIKIV